MLSQIGNCVLFHTEYISRNRSKAKPARKFFLVYLESSFLPVAYSTLVNLAQLGI